MREREREDRNGRLDPNAQFLGEQSQQRGNDAGPELALYRLVRWLMTRTWRRR